VATRNDVKVSHVLLWASRRTVVIGVFLVTGLIGGYASLLPIEIAIALPLVLVGGFFLIRMAWRRPDFAVIGLVIGLPFQQLILARAFAWGVGPRVLSPARFWKEVLLTVIVARALTHVIKLARIDRWAVAYVAITAIYVAIPFGPNELYVRTVAAREITTYVIAFLAVRHLPLPESTGKKLEDAVLVIGVIMSGLAYWNHFDAASWSDWFESTKIQEYQRTLVGDHAVTPAVVYQTIAGRSVVRAGSLMTYLTLPYYLAIPASIALVRTVSGRASRLAQFAGLVCALGILVTLTRSAIALAPLVAAVALWYGRRKGRVAIALVVASIALFPLASSINLGDLVASGFDSENESTEGHIDRLKQSNERMFREPLGSGLGTSATVAQRFGVEGGITNESWYFQIGTQTGFLGMFLYIAFVVVTFRALGRQARRGSARALCALCALTWISLGGVVLHTLSDLSVSFTLWLIVALALNRTDLASATASEPDSVSEEMSRPQPAAVQA
jgi:hypothetical protein